MRLLLGKSSLSALAIVIVLFLYINFRDSFLSPSNPVERKDKVQPTTTKIRTARKNLSDEVERLTEIVDSLPQVALPKTLKFGFEFLSEERPQQPITPSLPPADAEAAFYKYIQTLQINCPTKTRIGRNEDGGWDACIAGPFNISEPCLVYSIGMGGEWSFDHMITDKYKCLDMAYDPTLGKGDHRPKELLWFYNTGLGIANMVNSQNWKMRTFEKILEENGHTNKTIDILKMDIEYSEWESFEAILKQGSLRNVKQLMVEFHTMEVHEGKHSTSKDYSYYWQVLRGLDRLGYKTWHYLATPTGHYTSVYTNKKMACCANVYFVNTNLLV